MIRVVRSGAWVSGFGSSGEPLRHVGLATGQHLQDQAYGLLLASSELAEPASPKVSSF